MKKAIPVICAIVLIVVIGAVAFGSQIIEKYSYSSEKADVYEYFHIVKQEEVAIVLQDEMMAEKALLIDGKYYFDMATVQAYFNDRFYVDETEGLLIYTTPTQVIKTVLGASTYTVDAEEIDAGYIISLQKGDAHTYYIAVDYVKQYTNFSYEVFTDPNHMQVYTQWDERKVANIKKDNAVRLRGGVKSPILTEVLQGETVVVLEEMENWSRVKTPNAYIGYIENSILEEEREEALTPVTDYEVPEYTSLTKDKKICLGWHAIYSVSGNDTLGTVTANATGMNVIAPTWFSLSDNQGHFQSLAQASYVEKAHQKGLEVWGVIDDFNYKSNNNAEVDLYTILSTTTSRTQLVTGIMEATASCGMDGINIDFESVNKESGIHFVQFLRELSIECRKNGIVLSVDNYVPFNFNSYYDLEEQGAVADYVIIMGYDEHWAGCQEAGSVASINYVKNGIEKAVSYVPSKKVVNALPFYTRLWITSGVEVSSEAYPMSRTEEVLKTYGMTTQWDEETNQNYGRVETGGKVYEMWVEDSKSILAKVNVMQNLDLGGVAAWRLGHETAGIWDILAAYVGQ